MPCYAMLSYAMPCYVMLCYAMLCYAMLCYAMLCYAMLCYAMLCYAMLCYAIHHILSCHKMQISHNTHRGVFPSEGSELFNIAFCPQNLELNSFRAVLVLKNVPPGN